MDRSKRLVNAAPLAVGSGVVAVLWMTGSAWFSPAWWSALALLAAFVGFKALRRWRGRRDAVVKSKAKSATAVAAPREQAATPQDIDALVDMMLGQSRYAMLLRPQVRENLSKVQLRRTMDALSEHVSEIAAGEVHVRRFEHTLEDLREEHRRMLDDESLHYVDGFLLDRCCVTNRQFMDFVAAGGYEDASLWAPEIRAAIDGFHDSTGSTGPRYWKNGAYPAGDADLPVVGVSWYEASAYARWVGKRLPSDAEWVKAASSPVKVAEGAIVQRRFPWGDGMDHARANVWSSAGGKLAVVKEFPSGACSGGVLQLVGNVWEWNSDDFGAELGRESLLLPAPMKCIRGAAFDTYLESQCTSQFQSGENPIARKHNIGFRCALSLRALSGDDEAVAPHHAAPLHAESQHSAARIHVDQLEEVTL